MIIIIPIMKDRSLQRSQMILMKEKTVEVEAGDGFMQGIFVQYGITLDDDVTEVRNGGFGSTNKKEIKD